MSEPFTLQLHITDRCQLSCRHCYRDIQRAELPLHDLACIVDQFLEFCRMRQLEARLTIAGGEPLLRLGDLLALCRQAAAVGVQTHLLSNGLLLTPQSIAELRQAGCIRVQVSIDGDEAVHDQLRGAGVYRQSVAALRQLRDAGMWSTISMTLGQWNAHCLQHVAALAQDCRAKLFVARYVPCGAGMSLQPEMLEPGEWKRAMLICRRISAKRRSGVAMRDPHYVPLVEKDPGATVCAGGCAIGYNGLAVDSDGTVYPCRRLPVPLGNLLREPLEHVWQHPLLEQLRDRDRLKGQCGACRWRWRCGGCRAIAYGLTGDPLSPDPQCPFHRWQREGLFRRFHRRPHAFSS